MLVKTVCWNLAATLLLLAALPPPFRGTGGRGVQAQELNAPEEWLESMKLAHELVARSAKSKQTKAKHNSRHHHHRKNKSNPPQLQKSDKVLDQDMLDKSKLLLQKQKQRLVTIPELENGPGMAVYQKRQVTDEDEYEDNDEDDEEQDGEEEDGDEEDGDEDGDDGDEVDEVDDEVDEVDEFGMDQWPDQEHELEQEGETLAQTVPSSRLEKRGRGYPSRLEIEQRATAFKYFRADELVNEPVNLKVVHEFKPTKNNKSKQAETKKVQGKKERA